MNKNYFDESGNLVNVENKSLAEIYMDGAKQNRWISVEDALPEIKTHHISDTVLCYCDSGALAVARLEENAFGQVGFNCEKDDSYHCAVGKVLYWMPIPEIPEPPESEVYGSTANDLSDRILNFTKAAFDIGRRE